MFGSGGVVTAASRRRARRAHSVPALREPAQGPASPIRVLIATDVRLYRESLAEILSRYEGIEVVGVAGDRLGMFARVADVKPDVVLLERALQRDANTISELIGPAGEIKVVTLGVSETDAEVIACAEAGVAGFVSRDDSLADLIAAIHGAARGDLLCSPQTAGTLLRRVAALAAGRSSIRPEARLTTREFEVVQLIDEGLSNKQIALRLCIELPTVKHHVHHILEKLGVARRGEAVSVLRHAGLLQAVALAGSLSPLSL